MGDLRIAGLIGAHQAHSVSAHQRSLSVKQEKNGKRKRKKLLRRRSRGRADVCANLGASQEQMIPERSPLPAVLHWAGFAGPPELLFRLRSRRLEKVNPGRVTIREVTRNAEIMLRFDWDKANRFRPNLKPDWRQKRPRWGAIPPESPQSRRITARPACSPPRFRAPPPPSRSAIAATFTLPLLRRLRRIRCSGNSRKKRCRLDAGNADGIIHNALAILFRRAGAHHVLIGHRKPGEPALALEIAEAAPSSSILAADVEKYTSWAMRMGLAPASVRSCASANVEAFVDP